jgi:hypothetical protein
MAFDLVRNKTAGLTRQYVGTAATHAMKRHCLIAHGLAALEND